MTGGRVQREQPRIDRGQENTLSAGTVNVTIVRPECHAAVHQSLGIMRMQIDPWIEAPYLFSGLRVEREDTIEGRAQKHCSANNDRCGFKRAFGTTVAAIGNITGVQFPCLLQLNDIGLVNLIQPRIAASSRVTSIRGPITGSGVVGFVG
jgi:hypothetical protein